MGWWLFSCSITHLYCVIFFGLFNACANFLVLFSIKCWALTVQKAIMLILHFIELVTLFTQGEDRFDVNCWLLLIYWICRYLSIEKVGVSVVRASLYLLWAHSWVETLCLRFFRVLCRDIITDLAFANAFGGATLWGLLPTGGQEVEWLA